MKAPLLLGNDVRTMDAASLGVVMNKDALNISQDELGVQVRDNPYNPYNPPPPSRAHLSTSFAVYSRGHWRGANRPPPIYTGGFGNTSKVSSRFGSTLPHSC